MITLDLIDYIQSQLRKSIPKEKIILKLSAAGWKSEDIDEAFKKLTPPEIKKPAPAPVPIERGPDQYRELPETNPRQDIGLSPSRPPEVTQPAPAVPKQPKIAEPVFSKSFSGANSGSAPLSSAEGQTAQTPQTPNFSVMKPKVISVPPAPAVLQTPPLQDMRREQKVMEPEAPHEAFIPKLIEKKPAPLPEGGLVSTHTEFNQPNIMPLNRGFQSTTPATPPVIPQTAVLYSYPQALSSQKNMDAIFTPSKKKKILPLILGAVGILGILGGGYWFVSGNFHFSFIKKDPKELLSQAGNQFKTISSYKVEHTISISAPTFSNITLGLVSGEVPSSNERDTVALDMKGAVEHGTNLHPDVEYTLKATGSLLKKDLSARVIVTANGETAVDIPDLSQFGGPLAPAPQTILVEPESINLLGQVIPQTVQEMVSMVQLPHAATVVVPSLGTGDMASMLKDTLTTSSVSDKGSEVIKGANTYHYSLVFDAESSKKLLTSIVHYFSNNLSASNAWTIDQSLGAVTMSPLDIWVGKDDGLIHQFAFTLTEPLSKILNLEDRGIAGNIVTLNWKTTYSDIGVPNTIRMPETPHATVQDLINEIHDSKIRNLVAQFKTNAQAFRAATGNFGRKENNGSCKNPTPGSIFSPIGNPKGASTAVGGIADVMNQLIDQTGGGMSCYSSPTAWAMSLAWAEGGTVCVDSTQDITTVQSTITKAACEAAAQGNYYGNPALH